MNRFYQFFVHSWAATVIAALLCMAVWGHYIAYHTTGWTELYPSLLNLTLYLVFGLLLNNAYGHTATGSQRITLSSTLFFMGCAITPQIAPWQEGTICLVLMGTAYHLLSYTFRNHTSMGSYFTAFSLIGIASLCSPKLLYITPILILACTFMQSLHIRTSLAAILGILFPYWTAFCILYLTNNTHLISSFAAELTTSIFPTATMLHLSTGTGHSLAIPTIVLQIGWTLLLVLPAIAHIASATSSIETRANRYFQIGNFGILLITVLVLPSLRTTLLPAILMLTAIIGYSFFVTGNKRRGRNIWALVLLVFWLFTLGLYVWNS